ncbi:uncharacterized protein LOC141909958 [Tubulanus polymorphus]|uniref:uncharacterized protein LOC141909958 n=1 Tax=Tubulanus polymorphus TaxID=672921 RepID=UPI003DA35607
MDDDESYYEPHRDSRSRNLVVCRPVTGSSTRHLAASDDKFSLPSINEKPGAGEPQTTSSTSSGLALRKDTDSNKRITIKLPSDQSRNHYIKVPEFWSQDESILRESLPRPNNQTGYHDCGERERHIHLVVPPPEQRADWSRAPRDRYALPAVGCHPRTETVAMSLHEYLNSRKGKRTNRPRPWQSNMKQRKYKDQERVEIFYECYLPKDKWVKYRPMQFVTNHKWGEMYECRQPNPRQTNKNKNNNNNEEKNSTKTYVFDNEYNVWLLEKMNQNDFKNKPKRQILYEKYIMPNGKTPHISAHQELVERFHFYKLNRLERREAAVIIQRTIRGWLVRNRFRKLKKEVLLWHARSWTGFIGSYKDLLSRVQRRYGIAAPPTPVDLDDLAEHLQNKKKYEDVFDQLSIGGKLDREKLRSFFTKCGLYPADEEISTAFDVVFRGCGTQADVVFILDLSASLGPLLLPVQTDFVVSAISRLQISADHVRVGVIPYSDAIGPDSIRLGEHDRKEDLVTAIRNIKYMRGLTHTHLAIERMREMFKQYGRPGVQKIGVVITDGKSYENYQTVKQAQLAKQEFIKLYALGIGNKVDRKELHQIATDPTYISSVYDFHILERIKTDVSRTACLKNCTLCHFIERDECLTRSRGLYKAEVFEILWTIYVPKGTGLRNTRRSTWMRPLVAGEEAAKWLGLVRSLEDDDFRTCLRYVIKSKLDRDGFVNFLSPTGNGSGDLQPRRLTDWNAAMAVVENYLEQEERKRVSRDLEMKALKEKYVDIKQRQTTELNDSSF